MSCAKNKCTFHGLIAEGGISRWLANYLLKGGTKAITVQVHAIAPTKFTFSFSHAPPILLDPDSNPWAVQYGALTFNSFPDM